MSDITPLGNLSKLSSLSLDHNQVKDLSPLAKVARLSTLNLNDNQVAAALEPFRTRGVSDQTSDASAVSLSLTKALVEANRAQFHIRPGPHTGTLVEVVFSRAVARA